MFNIKTATLLMGLASLTCQPQAWAMDEEELKGSENVGSVSIKPASEPQEDPSDVATQLQIQLLENEKLAAQIATIETQKQLEEERLKTAALQAQLAALQASSTSTPTPTLSQVYKNAEHDVKKTYKKTERDVKIALGLRKPKKQ